MDFTHLCREYAACVVPVPTILSKSNISEDDALLTYIRTQQPTSAQVAWLREALDDTERRKFAAMLFRDIRVFPETAIHPTITLPESLFTPMLRAAIDEQCPTDNKHYVIPCLRAFGGRRVNMALLDYVEHGTNHEIVGATNALYWAKVLLEIVPEYLAAIDGDMDDVWARKRILLLTTFVQNPDGAVRRAIVSHLDLNTAHYPSYMVPLVVQAIGIGIADADSYIRERIACQV